MSSETSLYNVFFNEHEYSLEFADLISANTTFITHCSEQGLLPPGVFAEIREIRHSLCRLNIYYSDQYEDVSITPAIIAALVNSEAIPSLFKLRHMMVVECAIEGEISIEHWKERSDVAGLVRFREFPPASERSDHFLESYVYDADDIKELQKNDPMRSIFSSFRSFFPGLSSSSRMRN